MICRKGNGIILGFVALAAALLAADRVAAEEPITIEKGVTQLFVDDFLIDEQLDLRRALRQPVKDNNGEFPVIELDGEFGDHGSMLGANGTIVYDKKLRKWVMFALGFAANSRGWDKVRRFRFTSDDALAWYKGDDGKAEQVFPLKPEDMIDPQTGEKSTNIDLFSCYYDEADDQYPYKGWQWFSNFPTREGIYYVYSADGIRWERGERIVPLQGRKISQDGFHLTGGGDVTIFSRDSRENRFLALIKFYNDAPIGPNNRQRSRTFLYVDRLDQPVDMSRIERIDMVPPTTAQAGDLPHDEYYSSSAWRYGAMWLGGLKIWHGGGDYAFSAPGCAFLKFISSRDGLHWEKVRFDNNDGVPEVWIPNGPEGGNNGRNDGGYMTEFSQGPLRIGDELIYYYGASSFGKNFHDAVRVTGGGIFRARLRPDGFVSVDSGKIVTKPLNFDGDELFLNSMGTLSVEVLDLAGERLAGARVVGDSLRHRVRFEGKTLREVAPDGRARLSFEIRQREPGRYYSFTIE